MKKALITGITGQDGSYLAEFLLEKGYEVHGLIRRSSISNTGRIDHLIREDKIVLHGGDMTDSTSLVRIIGEVRPDEIYNLGEMCIRDRCFCGTGKIQKDRGESAGHQCRE